MATKLRTDELEAWRDALIAFYKADCCFQSAENLEVFKQPFTVADKRIIECLKAAVEWMPIQLSRAA
jgi:hypothetical protein